MTRDAKLKIATGLATVGAGIAGGIALGPAGAAAGGLTALSTFLLGLYHQTPARKSRVDKRGQVDDLEEPR